MRPLSSIQIRIFAGLIIGAIVAFVGNLSFQGEISPIVIVISLPIAAISILTLEFK